MVKREGIVKQEDFDPYRKWLGIPPAEQPPHHYRLLGISVFEDDADVIESAADQRMAHVRTFQVGPHSAQSQSLLNELSAARVTLLNEQKKAAYDVQLRAALAATKAHAPNVPIPLAAASPQIAPRESSPPAIVLHAQSDVEPRRLPAASTSESLPLYPTPAGVVPIATHGRRPRSWTMPAVGTALAVVALVIAALSLMARRSANSNVSEVPARQDPRPLPPIQNARNGKSRAAVSEFDATPAPRRSKNESESLKSSPAPKAPPTASALPASDKTSSKAADNKMANSLPLESTPSPAPIAVPPPVPPPSGARSLAELLDSGDRQHLKSPQREPPPNGRELTSAKAAFMKKYGQEISSANTQEQVRNLRTRLVRLAKEGAEPSEIRYAMLLNAGASASTQGRIGPAYLVANEIARQFQVDPHEIKLKALEASGKSATTPAAFAVGALQSLALAERAALAGRGDVASRAASQASAFARMTKNENLIVQVDRGKAALREQSVRSAAYLKALANLKKSPDDVAANLVAGKYETLVLGEWREGLLKLAASSDGGYAAIAGLEGEARADLSQWAPLAAAWWSAAAVEADEFFKRRCQLQAKYAYLRARDAGQSGAIPTEVVEQVKKLAGYPLSRLRPGAAGQYFAGANFQRLLTEREDAAIDFHFGEGSPGPEIPNNSFSVRWSGFIKPPVSGRYRLATYTDDGVRLWIDGQPLINRWEQNVGTQAIVVDLTGELHTFRLEYNETIGPAFAMFSWALADFEDADYMQWTTVDALYYDPESAFQLPVLEFR